MTGRAGVQSTARPSEPLIGDRRQPANALALAELLAARVSEAAIGVDRAARVVLMNGLAEELLGRREDCAGRHVGELLGFAHGERTALEEAIGGGRVRVHGGEGELRVTVVPCRRKADGGGGLVLVEDRDRAREVQDDTERLAALGRLSAGVAHEIRNPLSGIDMNAQVLARRVPADDPTRRPVDLIRAEVGRLNGIIEEMLQFARPPAPSMRLHAITAPIERALLLTGDACEQAGIEVVLAIDPKTPEVFGDPDQLAQVFVNLMWNARHAMPEGGRLEVSAAAGDRAEVVVTFVDTGRGIPAEDLPRLFEPFFTRRSGGTGLGLAVCQALVRQHRGSIDVASVAGRGTTVRVMVPVEKRRG